MRRRRPDSRTIRSCSYTLLSRRGSSEVERRRVAYEARPSAKIHCNAKNQRHGRLSTPRPVVQPTSTPQNAVAVTCGPISAQVMWPTTISDRNKQLNAFKVGSSIQ